MYGRKVIPGTEEMLTWPVNAATWGGFWKEEFGIEHYGYVKYKGQACYRFDKDNIEQMKSLGWEHVHTAQTYAYMRKPSV